MQTDRGGQAMVLGREGGMKIYIDDRGTLRNNSWCSDSEAEEARRQLERLYHVEVVSSLPGPGRRDKVALMQKADGLLIDDDPEILDVWRRRGGISVHASQLRQLAQVLAVHSN